jgi:3-phosphoglycerate kinase
MVNPSRPLGAIIGGAKVSSKIDVLKNLVNKVDFIIIGGGMAFTFYKAMGLNVGKSLMEEELVGSAKEILEYGKSKKVDILLPTDIVLAAEFKNDSPKSISSFDKIPDDKIGLDIGPESIKLFSERIKGAKTIIWNGPMGAFEMPNFSDGTNSIAKVVAESGCLSIVGGGDSITAINQAGLSDKISYISTGGGAFLELMEGKTLPAIKALDK